MWGRDTSGDFTSVTPGSKAAKAKAAMTVPGGKYDKAQKKTKAAKAKRDENYKPDSPINKAKAETAEKQKAVNAAQSDITKSENNIKKSEAKIETTENKITTEKNEISDNNDKIDDNKERISELIKDGSPEALATAKDLEQQNKDLAQENTDLNAEITEDEKTISEEKSKIETEEAKTEELESKKEKADEELDTAKENQELEQEKVDADQEAYDTAKEEESDVREELVDEYPEKYGKLNNELEKAAVEDTIDKHKREKEAAEDKFAEDLPDKIENVKPPLTQEQKDELEFVESNADFNKQVSAFQAKNVVTRKKKEISDLKDKLKDPNLGVEEKNKIIEEIYDKEKKFKEITKESNSEINEILSNSILSKLKSGQHDAAYLHWDSPKTMGLTGKLEDLIAENMQPKMKFAYMGEFSGKLQPLDWMIKSMDKPKIDIESVEQIRNNVKRNYPIKYNYGDLSVTFWDDMNHKTIMSLYNYFTESVWYHKAVPLTGTFKLRDSILIPQFHIYELTIDSSKHLKYTFENAILTSFDFDNSEDESDDGVHTVQAVFKIERFEVVEGQSPRVINPYNKPLWM